MAYLEAMFDGPVDEPGYDADHKATIGDDGSDSIPFCSDLF
jgi:hypothetical protein